MKPHNPANEPSDPPTPGDVASHATDELYPHNLGNAAWIGVMGGWLVWSFGTKHWSFPAESDYLDYLVAAACITGGMLLSWLYLRLAYANKPVHLPTSALAAVVVIWVYFCVVAATHSLNVKHAVLGAVLLAMLMSSFDRHVLQKRRHTQADRLRRKRIVDRRMHR